jgi:hypothetical protein
MSGHNLARSTHTVEMAQVVEINERLAAAFDSEAQESLLITAELLGLAGATVHPNVADRPVAALIPRQRSHNEVTALPGPARLVRVLAAGAPSYPYLYGAFAESAVGQRELPAILHTEQLKVISSMLRLRSHQWGS